MPNGELQQGRSGAPLHSLREVGLRICGINDDTSKSLAWDFSVRGSEGVCVEFKDHRD